MILLHFLRRAFRNVIHTLIRTFWPRADQNVEIAVGFVFPHFGPGENETAAERDVPASQYILLVAISLVVRGETVVARVVVVMVAAAEGFAAAVVISCHKKEIRAELHENTQGPSRWLLPEEEE